MRGRRPGSHCLLLNASHEPHSIIAARDAVVMYLFDEADVITFSDEVYHSPSIEVPVPSVMRLRKYVVMPPKYRSVLLTHRAVLARDDHECGYCGAYADTIDHIHPRAHGGKHQWENVVAACRRCNRRKSDKTLDELGWELKKRPYRPIGILAQLLTTHMSPEWEPYLRPTA